MMGVAGMMRPGLCNPGRASGPGCRHEFIPAGSGVGLRGPGRRWATCAVTRAVFQERALKFILRIGQRAEPIGELAGSLDPLSKDGSLVK
jgi:hypothetical protein